MSNTSAQDVRPKKVQIKLDKDRTLFFDLNSFAELEEAYGSVEEAMKVMESGSIKAVRTLLWAGLIHEEMDEEGNYKITPKQVGSWITLDRMTYISDKLGQAIRSAVPQTEADTGKAEKGSAPLASQQPSQKK